MVNAELGAPQPGEVAFGLIGASAVIGLELDRVVDAPRIVGGMEPVPMSGFVCMDSRAGRDVFPDHRKRIALARHNPNPCPALPLAGDDDNLPIITVLAATICAAVFWSKS